MKKTSVLYSFQTITLRIVAEGSVMVNRWGRQKGAVYFVSRA